MPRTQRAITDAKLLSTSIGFCIYAPRSKAPHYIRLAAPFAGVVVGEARQGKETINLSYKVLERHFR